MPSLLFDRLSATLERNLDYRLERANVIHANLANVDTPGYTPLELKFEEQLRRFLAGEDPEPALEQTEAEHMPGDTRDLRAEPEFDLYSLPDVDGNAVDLDHEMVKLQANQSGYRASTRAYNKRMALMKYAITEGGR
jgi:flagellar basal-body rod protein FlgB